MNAEEALDVVRTLGDELAKREKDAKQWQDYYDGEQPLKFATDEYRAHFGHQYDGFRDNWCAPVADAVPEMLRFAGLRLPREAAGSARAADAAFARVWDVNEGPGEFSMALTEASIARRAFALVWGEGEDKKTPEITFETPDQAIVAYEPGSRRKRLYGLKMWQQDEKLTYATLYTRDALWKWQKRSSVAGTSRLILPSSVQYGSWQPRQEPEDDSWPIPNPAGVVPLIELPNRPRLNSEPLSEVAGVASMQDAINVIWSYLFTAADFAALPQRVVLGAALPKIPVLDKDGQPISGVFKTAEQILEPVLRNRLLSFQGDSAKIAQWDAADLEVFTKVVEFAVGHVAAQSRTAITRFFTGGNISNVSEGGLKALSEAQTTKAQERSIYYGSALREIAATGYLMIDDANAAAAAREATVEWEDFEVRSESALGDKLLKQKQTGFSFEYIASQVIKDPVELAAEIERHNAEQRMAAEAFNFATPPPGE